MKNKECLHVASVDVGVLLESHCKQCYVYSLDVMAVLFSATLTPHRLYADISRHERNTDEALPTSTPRHRSRTHLHLVDVGWVVSYTAHVGDGLTAAVRHLPAFCTRANIDALSPVS